MKKTIKQQTIIMRSIAQKRREGNLQYGKAYRIYSAGSNKLVIDLTK